MAKTKISEFSTTAGNNTDINSINIAEGCAPSGINDAIRELMRQLKEFQTGGAGDSVNSGGDFSVATNKFTVASASGNTAVAGTLAVTGVATLTAQPILSSLTASKAVFTDASKGLVSNDVTGTGNVVMSNSPTLVTPALGTPASGVVTNLTGTASININGTVGATTPSTGAFTTLSSTGNTTLGDASGDTITVNGTTTFVNANPTLSAGTANGVLYLNGSKVATSGSALTFDGTTLGNTGGIVAGGSSSFYGAAGRGNVTSRGTSSAIFALGVNGVEAGYLFGTGSVVTLGAPTGVPITFEINGEQMRLTSTGLGIGTSSPSAKLNVVGSGDMSGIFESTGTSNAASAIIRSGNGTTSGLYAYARFVNNDSNAQDWRIGTYGNNNLSIVNAKAGTTPVVLDTSGRLLVGLTSSSGGKVQVLSETAGTQCYLSWNTAASGTRYFHYFGVGSGASPTGVGSITSDGSVTAYNTSSDYRLKDNQQPLTGSGAFIDALQPKTWNWKADGSRGVGFIAHEVQEVSPGSVVGEKDGERMQSMEYGSAEFIANIIAELQSLRKRLADAGIA